MRPQINHTQHLHLDSWRPDNADWVQNLIKRRQIEIRRSRVQKIYFTTQNRTNTGAGFCCLYFIFFYKKQGTTPLYLLCWIKNTVSRTSKYRCKITPTSIHEARSQINYTQHFCSKYWWLDNADWVWQFISRRQIETSVLRVKNISFTTQNGTNTITGVYCLYLTFVSMCLLWLQNRPEKPEENNEEIM